jgi:mannitol 2-dehydrogenase
MPVFAGWGLDAYPAFTKDVVALRTSMREHGVRHTLKNLGLS